METDPIDPEQKEEEGQDTETEQEDKLQGIQKSHKVREFPNHL